MKRTGYASLMSQQLPELGPSWERMHTRSENEWKGGGRVAFRVVSNFSLVFFVLAPKTEFRVGILIHPERKD